MSTTRFLLQLSMIGGLFLGCTIPARAQTTVEEMCADHTFHPAGFDCTAYLCGNGYAQAHGMGSACPSSAAAGTNTNALKQTIVNEGTDAISDMVYRLLRGDPDAKAAADAAAAQAAEAERERQAEIARQQALEEQRRQAIFDRLSTELKMSAFGDMQLKGFGSSVDEMQLKGFDTSADNGAMQLKGFGDAAPGNDAVADNAASGGAAGGQTCFFGECGPQNPDLSEPIEAWNDPNVVDLRDLQQGEDLAVVATKAPPADRQAIMDQALAAANGDQSIQITMPPGNAVPVMSEQGLLAFQQANNAYRQAHDSAYQLQQSYQLNQQREAAANAIVTQTRQQLEADLRANIDQMTLEQKELAMAQIFDAALQQDLAYGKTLAQYLAARQKYYQDRYELQMYLWKVALGGQGNPPPVPPQLSQNPAQTPTGQDAVYLQQVQTPSAKPAATIAGPPDSDLSLVLPVGPTVAPTNEDLNFLRQIALQPPDPTTQSVIDSLRQEEATLWNKQAALSCPPNILNQYQHDPQFQQQMNAESKTIYAQQQQARQAALQDGEVAWNQDLADWQSKGLYQPGIPLAQQEQGNPQLAAQVAAAQKQITANLDYKVTRADYQAQRQWQQWIEQQEATLKPPTMPSIAAARD
jgi:hypothetical protein